ncbi:Protein CBG05759 [Caenorhabditis briggsae]|uniref:Protein CBG05759 n=1 Tax=Caenorhabditis briggsae TaxID=6238 RepID=A8X1P7_CAEBR|nr:Protein CBG05759 [Caenorhabditis briggsae]CAP26557.1 Protein CBG05759 [Caenorhabditis briggsae]
MHSLHTFPVLCLLLAHRAVSVDPKYIQAHAPTAPPGSVLGGAFGGAPKPDQVQWITQNSGGKLMHIPVTEKTTPEAITTPTTVPTTEVPTTVASIAVSTTMLPTTEPATTATPTSVATEAPTTMTATTVNTEASTTVTSTAVPTTEPPKTEPPTTVTPTTVTTEAPTTVTSTAVPTTVSPTTVPSTTESSTIVPTTPTQANNPTPATSASPQTTTDDGLNILSANGLAHFSGLLPTGQKIRDLPDQFEIYNGTSDGSRIVANNKGLYVLHPVQRQSKEVMYDPHTIGQVLGYLYEKNEFGNKKPPGGKYSIELFGGKVPTKFRRGAPGTRRARLVFRKKEFKKSSISF